MLLLFDSLEVSEPEESQNLILEDGNNIIFEDGNNIVTEGD